jgi:hypothetical protein
MRPDYLAATPSVAEPRVSSYEPNLRGGAAPHIEWQSHDISDDTQGITDEVFLEYEVMKA